MAEEEEVSIEQQVEYQLKEQKESLSVVDDALASDSSNTELLSVREELIQAIRDAEEALFHLKRSRLLKEADAILLKQESGSMFEDVKVEPLDPRQVEPEPLDSEYYSVGSKCRFRHTDGRWYNGHIIDLEGADSARISFLTPTSESMLVCLQICKFFLQQRCRFGSNCRLSHGFCVPIASLKQYSPTIWHRSLVGSSILAARGGESGIWRNAELESWDDKLKMAQVVFKEDGTSAKLGTDALSISKYAEMSESGDEEPDDATSDESESLYEDDDPENQLTHQGIGLLEATSLTKGVQTETALFATWEHHTRGIASKMMASMGYREGMGLGISGQGILDPIHVKVLPKKQSLDHAVASKEDEENGANRDKKKSRGGRRKRLRKFVEADRAANSIEEGSNVFSFINNQLAGQNGIDGLGNKSKMGSREDRREDRRSLVAYDDEVKELKIQVEKLEEMVSRNRKDKMMFEAASRKLNETRKALAEAEATHASASNAVVSKEREKKWLKF
ncbi:zinc finger CCCH domain-containing protein 18 [Iris pallida]|uniref:Zinc finger CCCH domain-containing protein 18 n=1 Tax=Iris pallida TaxID=29817 RepID=A0AAX6ERB0_IRIPA|nr:zinc finger CCCH domain-containing protein 18 [Iris pallida]KAJ6825327.1 zinc finger CCCH domain-containing protein 18 [Iris pallida]